MPDLTIISLTFSENTIEVTYCEPGDQSENVMLFRSLVLNRGHFDTQVSEILEDVVDMIDAGVVELRSPRKRDVSEDREGRSALDGAGGMQGSGFDDGDV